MKKNITLARPADALLPAAFCAAAMLGRGSVALWLCGALLLGRICALSSAPGLRTAFARQPSMRYVQGSAALALALQCAGAAVAAALIYFFHRESFSWTTLLSALLLNIECVFYEYLYAVGDGGSAALSRGITALLTLAGLLLCAPSGAKAPVAPLWLALSTAVSALAGLAVCAGLGGKFRPRMNGEVLRYAPIALLQTALYPLLALGAWALFRPDLSTFTPFFAGWTLVEACRTPFRRSPGEAPALNRALLIACGAAVAVAAPFFAGWVRVNNGILSDVPWCCAAVILGAVCAFALYGRVRGTALRYNP